MSRRQCLADKAPHRTIAQARAAAQRLSIHLNQKGVLAESLYVYRCPDCCALHLTRLPAYRGSKNTLVHEAAPEALQRWAMGQG